MVIVNYFHVVLADEMREVEFSTIVATKGKTRAAINHAAKEGSKKFPFMDTKDWYCLYVKQVNGPW